MTHLEQCTQTVHKNGIFVEVCNHRTTPPHKHDFFELVYVQSGKTLHSFNNSNKIIKAGDFFLIDLETVHSYTAIQTEEPFSIINCMFAPDFLNPALTTVRQFDDILKGYLTQFAHEKFPTPPARNIYHDSDGKVQFLIKQMLNEYNAGNKEYTEVIRSFLTTVMVYLVRNESTDTAQTKNISFMIKDFILKNYNQQLNLSEICQGINFSLSNISIIFERDVGMSFRSYLQKVRIEKACELLARADKTIAEIADLVGYSDPSFFYRIFKKNLNVTPLEYRKNASQI